MVLVRPEENSINNGERQESVNIKTPKRVLHFCDGTLEEYSTDEEDTNVPPPQQTIVDPTTLDWGAWLWYKMWATGSSTLSVLDTVGEFLAGVFGITTPRYYFELEEYKKREEQKKNLAEEEKGWSKPSGASLPLNEVATSEPQPVMV